MILTSTKPKRPRLYFTTCWNQAKNNEKSIKIKIINKKIKLLEDQAIK